MNLKNLSAVSSFQEAFIVLEQMHSSLVLQVSALLMTLGGICI